MNLFGGRDDMARDYDALLGKSVHDDILVLTESMRVDNQTSLDLQQDDVAQFSQNDVETAKDRLRQELERKYQNDVSDIQDQIQKMERERADAQFAMSEARNQSDETIQRLCRLQRDGMEGASRIDEQRQQIRSLKAELAVTRDSLGEAQFKLSDFEDRMALRKIGVTQKDSGLKSRLDAARLELENMTSERDELIARENIVRDTLSAAQDKFFRIRAREEETQAENALTMAQNRALRKRQDELLVRLDRVSDRSQSSAQASPSIAEVTAQNRDLVRQVEVLEQRLEDARNEMEMMSQVNDLLRLRQNSDDMRSDDDSDPISLAR